MKHTNHNGWIKLHRCSLSNPIAKKPYYSHLWHTLLLLATHRTSTVIVGKRQITLRPGQLLTGRKALFEQTGIPATTIERILDYLVGEQQIGQQKTNKFRIITITNWEKYQSGKNGGQQSGQRRGHIQEDNKEEYSSDSQPLRLAELLLDSILERKPNFTEGRKGRREKTLQRWAADIDKLIRIDKRKAEQIKAVIRWCQQDGFWQNNILSGKTLRKQIDKLELAMQKGKPTIAPIQRGQDGKTPKERFAEHLERQKAERKQRNGTD